MKVQNVGSIFVFRETASDHVLSLEEIKAAYGVVPDGTNFYY